MRLRVARHHRGDGPDAVERPVEHDQPSGCGQLFGESGFGLPHQVLQRVERINGIVAGDADRTPVVAVARAEVSGPPATPHTNPSDSLTDDARRLSRSGDDRTDGVRTSDPSNRFAGVAVDLPQADLDAAGSVDERESDRVSVRG